MVGVFCEWFCGESYIWMWVLKIGVLVVLWIWMFMGRV